MGARNLRLRRVAAEPRLFDVDDWLGTNPQDAIDDGNYERVWRGLVAWQEAVGRPGDPVSARLQSHVVSSLAATSSAKPALDEGHAIDELRRDVEATRQSVERAYLLNTAFTLTAKWGPISDFGTARRLDTFMLDTRTWASRHHIGYARRFNAPQRLPLHLTRSGSARLSATGDALKLQLLLAHIGETEFGRAAVRQSRGESFLRPIPSFFSVDVDARPMVTVPLERLVERPGEAELRAAAKALAPIRPLPGH